MVILGGSYPLLGKLTLTGAAIPGASYPPLGMAILSRSYRSAL
jgi:hypothetical protein